MNEDKLEVDINDIKLLLTLIEGGTERQRIINYVKEYIYNPKPEWARKQSKTGSIKNGLK